MVQTFFVYLSGKVTIETSSGKTKCFGSGDILYAIDIKGKGHRSTIIAEGKSLIISTDIDHHEGEGDNTECKGFMGSDVCDEME